jgi:hypothetical protein
MNFGGAFMVEKPNISYVLSKLKKELKKLEPCWNVLKKKSSYNGAIGKAYIQAISNSGILPVPLFTISNNNTDPQKYRHDDMYLNDDKKNKFLCFVNVLYEKSEMSQFVSTQTFESYVKNILKQGFVDCKNNIRRDFREYIQELFEKVISEIRNYEFCIIVQGIELKEVDEIFFDSVKLFKYTEHQMKFDLIEQEENFLGKFRNKICLSCTILGERKNAEHIAMRKFRSGIDYLRFLLCNHIKKEQLWRNAIKIDFEEKLLDKSSVRFCVDLDNKKIISQWNHAEAFQPFIINRAIFDYNQNPILKKIQKILLDKKENTEWENLIATAIYWCSEAQNEYNIDVAFFKFWTAIETLIPSSRGDKVTENVLNGATILYFYGTVKHDEINFKAEKRKLQTLYDKRSCIVHNGSTSDIQSSDLAQISNYAVDTVINAIFWSYKGYKKKKQVRESFETLSIANNLVKKKLYNRVEQRKRFLKRHNKS